MWQTTVGHVKWVSECWEGQVDVNNGLVEWFNATLKSMLRKHLARNQKYWDTYLPYLLFTYRGVPQKLVGFSPFEMLCGRRVRGPLDVLHETCMGESAGEQTVAEYMNQMQHQLQQMTELVHENLGQAQVRQQRNCNSRAKKHELNAFDQVLLLLAAKQKYCGFTTFLSFSTEC